MKTERLYATPGFSLEDLVQIAGSNRTHVSGSINHCAGINFNQWLNHLRLEEVIAHIHETDIETLAHQAGFTSRITLYHHFKVHTGLTPKQYIERERKNVISE